MPHPVRLAIAALIVALPRTAAACTPALRPDQHAERAAFYAALARPHYPLWGVSIAVALAWLLLARRRRLALPWARGIAAALVLAAVLQPAWWMEGTRGDCGMTRDLSALGVALVGVALFGVGAWRSGTSPTTA